MLCVVSSFLNAEYAKVKLEREFQVILAISMVLPQTIGLAQFDDSPKLIQSFLLTNCLILGVMCCMPYNLRASCVLGSFTSTVV